MQELIYCLTGFYPSTHKIWARVRDAHLKSTFCDIVWGSVCKEGPAADPELKKKVLGIIPRVLDKNSANGNGPRIPELRACLLIARTVSDSTLKRDEEVKTRLGAAKRSFERLKLRLRDLSNRPKRVNTQRKAVTLDIGSSDNQQQLINEIQDVIDSITKGHTGMGEDMEKQETLQREESLGDDVSFKGKSHGVEEVPSSP